MLGARELREVLRDAQAVVDQRVQVRDQIARLALAVAAAHAARLQQAQHGRKRIAQVVRHVAQGHAIVLGGRLDVVHVDQADHAAHFAFVCGLAHFTALAALAERRHHHHLRAAAEVQLQRADLARRFREADLLARQHHDRRLPRRRQSLDKLAPALVAQHQLRALLDEHRIRQRPDQADIGRARGAHALHQRVELVIGRRFAHVPIGSQRQARCV
ncbi:hypothetical protein ACXKTX_27725 [Burkholderia gladioli]